MGDVLGSLTVTLPDFLKFLLMAEPSVPHHPSLLSIRETPPSTPTAPSPTPVLTSSGNIRGLSSPLRVTDS